jgi:bacteriorhodopsin
MDDFLSMLYGVYCIVKVAVMTLFPVVCLSYAALTHSWLAYAIGVITFLPLYWHLFSSKNKPLSLKSYKEDWAVFGLPIIVLVILITEYDLFS